GRCGNHESLTEHGRWRNVERCKIARRIELERVAIVGVQLADTIATGETNSHRPRCRFIQPNATSVARSRSRHLHDQSSAADRGRGGVIAASLCDARTRQKRPRPPILLNSLASLRLHSMVNLAASATLLLPCSFVQVAFSIYLTRA